MVKCFYCNHDCHCNEEEHTDEYLDICTCDNCACEKKRTYKKEKDHGLDISFENEVKYE